MLLPVLVIVAQLVAGADCGRYPPRAPSPSESRDDDVSATPPGRPRITWRYARNPNFIYFIFSAPSGYYDVLQYSYQQKTDSKACTTQFNRPSWCDTPSWSRWSSWSEWSIWSQWTNWNAQSFSENIGKYPFSDVTMEVKARNRKRLEGTTATGVASISPSEPGSVANLKAWALSSTSITVTWQEPLDRPPKGVLERYLIRWNKNRDRFHQSSGHYSTTTNYIIKDLEAGQLYYIWVGAKNRDVPQYGNFHMTLATTLEGEPSPVRDLRQLKATKTSLTVTWEGPSQPQGKIDRYEVSMLHIGTDVDPMYKTVFSMSAEFDELTEDSSYNVSVKACNSRECSTSSTLIVWTQTDQPRVEGELEQMSSTATTVKVLLPALVNPPGSQWLLLVNRSKKVRETDDTATSELMKEAGDRVCREVDVGQHQQDCSVSDLDSSDSLHIPALVLGSSYDADAVTPSLEIIATLKKNTDSSREEFVVGDNQTYSRYHNAPLATGKKYSLIVVSQKSAGNYYKMKVSMPMVITAEAPTSTGVVAGAVVGVLLLLVLAVVLLILLRFSVIAMKKNQVDGSRNTDLVAFTEPWNNPTVHIDSARNSPVIPEQEEIPYPEQSMPTPEVESHYANLCKEIPEVQVESYLCRAIHSSDTDLEFMSVPAIMQKSCSDGELPCNIRKNRYKNNIPYNDTRVKLPLIKNQPGADYINASFVKGPTGKIGFIATQGPKEDRDNTIEDFWRMIWFGESHSIIMVANIIESGKLKVAKYWPDEKEKAVFEKSQINVTHISTEAKVDFTIRRFHLSSGREVREICQYHYEVWPDHDVPKDPRMLSQMLKLVRELPHSRPITIHCSAGVGRTGCVVLVLYLLDQLAVFHHICPRDALIAIRTDRPRMIQTPKQYKFSHELLLEMLYGSQTSLPCSAFCSHLPALRHHPSGLVQQYKKLKSLPKDMCYKIAENPAYAHLNRNQDVLPDSKRMIFLQSYDGGEVSQYINVVRINGMDRSDAYLAGEHPQKHTLHNAWRLVYERKVAVWVQLHSFSPADPNYPELVDGEGIQRMGSLSLSVGPLSTFQNFSQRWVEITSLKSVEDSQHHHVLLLSMSDWPYTQDLPLSPGPLLAVLEKLESMITITNQALITCRDGMTGCGVATALLITLARMKLLQEVDIYRSALCILYDRPQFLTSYEQYDFLHTAVETFIKANNVYANFS